MDYDLLEVITTELPDVIGGMVMVESVTEIDSSNTHLIENFISREEVEEYLAEGGSDKIYRVVGKIVKLKQRV